LFVFFKSRVFGVFVPPTTPAERRYLARGGQRIRYQTLGSRVAGYVMAQRVYVAEGD
jgi:hypothetical protein